MLAIRSRSSLRCSLSGMGTSVKLVGDAGCSTSLFDLIGIGNLCVMTWIVRTPAEKMSSLSE